jgi:hypothetical protein
MTRLRRRPRATYRVYGEKEYLAGVDPLGDWDDVPARDEEPVRPTAARDGQPAGAGRLQRLAGAAALTGAVGAVGGIVGLAGLRTHARALDRREIAQRLAPPPRVTASRGHTNALARATRRQIHPVSPSRRTFARRGTSARVSPGSASRAWKPARAIAASAPRITRRASAANAGPSSATKAPGATPQAPAATPSTASQEPPAPTEARPAAQSEFGFER